MVLTHTEFCADLLFYVARQRQIEILASEQQMFTYGGTFKFDVSTLDVNTYEAEVRCASSDVADQHEVAVFQVFSETLVMLRHPRVKRGKRLFQQRHALESSLPRGFHGQLARFLIERGRYGEYDFLVLKELLRIRTVLSRHRVVPGIPQMQKITA